MTLHPEPKQPAKPIVQVSLSHRIDDSHTRTMMTWVDKKPGLKKGSEITLKDRPGIVWVVMELYSADAGHEATDFDWHRKWDNNI